MHSGLDHSTLVTIIAARGSPSLDWFHYRFPKAHLHKFAAIVELNIQGIPSPSRAQDLAQLDHCISALSAALTNAIETAGKLVRETDCSALWWSKECSKACCRMCGTDQAEDMEEGRRLLYLESYREQLYTQPR
jgi:hypothetical protein